MTGALFAGTSSGAGKSLVVTGVCRALRRRGIGVAPFKALNMSNNSMVCPDGSEIGRAQYLQAQAAGVEPTSAMNPVLLKPGGDHTSHVVLRGRPHSTLRAGECTTDRQHLAAEAFAAYAELEAQHEIVLCEGAGSPAEINLRAGDYVNMGLARRFNLPVIVVGDIDRGGVLASLYGTWSLLDDDDRALLTGYLINKFRGDASILQLGLQELDERMQSRCFGVLPWLEDVWLDGEDALDLERWRADRNGAPRRSGATRLRIAVLRFPRISNATDIDALAHEPDVDVVMSDDHDVLLAADLVILPGSRATVSDLGWLRSRGLDQALHQRAAQDLPILGICGGYQMLAEQIVDGVETQRIEAGADQSPGLGLLPLRVIFHADKTTRQSRHSWRGMPVDGYEIHHGRRVGSRGSSIDSEAVEPFLGGQRHGPVWGTMLHGSMENDDFRRAWLSEVAELSGSRWQPRTTPGYAARRESMIETLADAMEEHVDLEAMLGLPPR